MNNKERKANAFLFLLVSIFFYYEGNFFCDIIFLRGIIMSDLEKNLEIIMQKIVKLN